ncbi:MAG: hypothetical protein J7J32_06705 [Candidatus Atribacteria bacterium]|nr:hypothetical protein [Candidatus Atribacteria bacterium]MCD6350331.1 hypothetical protein [Candidatus Atribacteria bacterium]
MNKKIFGVALPLILVLSLASAAFAQRSSQSSGWGQKLSGEIVEISGTIESLDLEAPQAEITVALANEKGVKVELGPIWFVKELNAKVGNSITVSGEWVDENIMVAYQLKMNGASLSLRNEDGTPLWSGNTQKNQTKQKNTYRHQSGPRDGSGNQWGNNAQNTGRNQNRNNHRTQDR